MEVTVDVPKLKVKHMRALEREDTFDGIVKWMVTHAGVSEAELDELTLPEMFALSRDVQSQIRLGMTLPKANGSSSSPS